jgi:hypothetical protein
MMRRGQRQRHGRKKHDERGEKARSIERVCHDLIQRTRLDDRQVPIAGGYLAPDGGDVSQRVSRRANDHEQLFERHLRMGEIRLGLRLRAHPPLRTLATTPTIVKVSAAFSIGS